MKRAAYILLFLLSLGIQFFAPPSKPTISPNSSADCMVCSNDYHALVGIQGESLTIANSGSIYVSAPTHFSSGASRVTFGKNRTRTAFWRRMIHHYQPVYLVFRGTERLESSPFATPVGSTYYIYALRRILC